MEGHSEAFARAISSRHEAQTVLDETLKRGIEPGRADEAWGMVRALQAQAQLDILHVISYDLSAINDSLPG